MASKNSRGKQTGVTPAKLKLIGVLGAVLMAVLYFQFGSSRTETAAAPAGSSRRLPAVAAAPIAEGKPAEDEKQQTTPIDAPPKKAESSSHWQLAGVRKVVEFDPFALPALFPQRLKEARDDKLAKATVTTDDTEADAAARAEVLKKMTTQFDQLQRQGVRVIMQQHDKFVALIGERTIHVGDEIEGFTVVAIDADGVRVARDLKQ